MSKIEYNLKKAVKNAKKCCGNATILAEKCKSTMTFGSKRWALDLLLRQTHTEEEEDNNSNCGKSCLQSNRHFYLKLSNFLNGGFRVLFSSLWASLDDLLFTSLDTRYRRLEARISKLERDTKNLEVRISELERDISLLFDLVWVHFLLNMQVPSSNVPLVSENERSEILAKCRELHELRDADVNDMLAMDKKKKLRKEFKDMCDPIFSRYKQQLAADAAGTSTGNRPIKSAAEDGEDESAKDELMVSTCPTGEGTEE